jgi:hypothetical protein
VDGPRGLETGAHEGAARRVTPGGFQAHFPALADAAADDIVRKQVRSWAPYVDGWYVGISSVPTARDVQRLLMA